TNDTVAAGMILEATAHAEAGRDDWPSSKVSATERRQRVGHAGGVVVLEGAGAEVEQLTAAYAVERSLFDRGVLATVVSGDAAEAAAIACAEAGVIAVCAGSRVAAAALRERLGADRVVAANNSIKEIATQALQSLAKR